MRSEVGVVGLRGQSIGPVEGEVEMAAAIVEFAGLTGGGFVFVEELADGVVHRFGKHERFGVVGLRAEVFEGDGDGEEFTERIPPQMVLKDGLALLEGEVIDAGVMSAKALREFMAREVAEAREQGVLFSLHMKATMMKVSDPIIFGHCVSVFFAPVLEKHAAALESIGFEPNNGIGDLYAKLDELPADQQAAIKADIDALYAERPALAMVDSDRGITNLHVPSDIIIDASMPAMIRTSGRMWGADGQPCDTKAVIPDRSYAGVYRETIDFCKVNGAFDVTTMGNVSNVGLMAKKAQEYGSHDKTFEIPRAGSVRVVDAEGNTLLSLAVEAGDIWRMCQTKDVAIRDWVKLAVTRARATGAKAIFWPDENRAHDRNLIAKVNEYLPAHNTDGLDIEILSPVEATKVTCQRCKDGLDSVSVTCLLYTSPSPRDQRGSRMPSSA